MSMTMILATVVDAGTEVVTTGGDDLGREWTDTTIALPEIWVPALGALIPVLTAMVTKYRQSGQRLVYSLVSAVLAVIITGVGALLDDVPDTVGGLLSAMALTLATSVGSYLLVWSQAGRGQGGINETLSRGGIV